VVQAFALMRLTGALGTDFAVRERTAIWAPLCRRRRAVSPRPGRRQAPEARWRRCTPQPAPAAWAHVTGCDSMASAAVWW